MKTRGFPIILFLIHFSPVLLAQNEGNQWVIGYQGFGNHNYSVMYLDFSGPTLKIEWHFDEAFFIAETCSNICDSVGQPILWTNGMQIFGKNGFQIADTIAFDENPEYWDFYYDSSYGPFGFPTHDGAIILPIPDSPNEYSVIYHSAEDHPDGYFQVSQFLETRVRLNTDGSYALLYKDALIGPYHKWYTGLILATRHANGRDWWLISFEENSPKYYSYLLDPKGIRLDHEGVTDSIVKTGLGQATFSSQGNYIARMDALSDEDGEQLTLYQADRCTGQINRIGTFQLDVGFYTGVAFSPSEKYMYADDNTHIWQWDLHSPDLSASKTLVDTFDGFVQPGWFRMEFGPMMAAPDGRIYIVPPAGSSEFMHVIDRPDLPASECRLRQHAIDLKVPNGRSAPNLPNFRLGPLDGSGCDTLGLNNLPVAFWRYEEDQPGQYHNIRFTDLSYFNPEVWHWDFDDGSTSDETHPVHEFESGLYHVCLTVSNSNASASSCQWVEILETAINEFDVAKSDLSIQPNPFHEKLVIQSASGLFRKAHIQLYDMNGRTVFDQAGAPVPVSIVLPALFPGIYLCVIREADGTVYNFNVMKI